MNTPSSESGTDWKKLLLNGEVGAIALIGLFFAIMLIDSIGLRQQAAFFPRIIGVAGLILVAVLFSQWVTAGGSGSPKNIDFERDETPVQKFRRLAIPLASAPAYALLLTVFGFYIAAGVVVATLPLLLGYRRPLFLIALAAGTVITLHVLFAVLLNIPIPVGIVGGWYLRNFVYLD